MSKIKSSALALGLALSSSFTAQATVVEVQTVLGNFEVNLFDETTPITVENFLGYVNSGAYFNNIVHRSIPEFVVQAGGFQYNDEFPPTAVTTAAPITNEPVLSNLRGTIAMAKIGSDPNSATSQWFVNLADNSANLDTQNGGFTVFGQVLGDGMDVVDAIAALTTYNATAVLGGAFDNTPLVDYENPEELAAEHLMLITDVVVTDPAVVTHPELTPTENTLIDAAPTPAPTPDTDTGSGSSGGSLGGIALLMSLLVAVRRRFS